jgi:hypothetical protein
MHISDAEITILQNTTTQRFRLVVQSRNGYSILSQECKSGSIPLESSKELIFCSGKRLFPDTGGAGPSQLWLHDVRYIYRWYWEKTCPQGSQWIHPSGVFRHQESVTHLMVLGTNGMVADRTAITSRPTVCYRSCNLRRSASAPIFQATTTHGRRGPGLRLWHNSPGKCCLAGEKEKNKKVQS